MSYTDRKYVPGHFVGHGQFQHFERPHWATLAGRWLAGNAPPVSGGFTQMHPPQNAGYVQVHPDQSVRRTVAHGLLRRPAPHAMGPRSAPMLPAEPDTRTLILNALMGADPNLWGDPLAYGS